MRRTKTATEVGLNSDMVAISPHQVIKEDLTGHSPIVALESARVSGAVEAQPLVLSFDSLSLEQMLRIVVYPAAESVLHYGLKDCTFISLGINGWAALPNVLKMLMESHSASGMLLDGEGEEQGPEGEVIHELIRQGLVGDPDECGRKYMLTDLGVRSISIDLGLHSPCLASGDNIFRMLL